ncbi:putative Na+-dependent transporter [Evansella vedderi]|uniref:Na+-dependent transporter n=1 Tax=Evansella vedderi TaxID=38282 RepID=A0ABT9ZS30_9BACI|nr:hypothetical protein [Evansella vedderi]MDQ0254046.1 putative Na+-dependent transporter [Evansella vedderi]
MSKFFHRFFISVLSVVIFSALAAGFQYTFQSAGELSFGLLLGIYCFYTAPVFILGGIPASYLVDSLLKKHKDKLATTVQNYFRSFSLYGIAGIIIMMIYAAISSIASGQFFFSIEESITNIIVGIAAAAVYYHITLLLQINWEKLKKQRQKEQGNEAL